MPSLSETAHTLQSALFLHLRCPYPVLRLHSYKRLGQQGRNADLEPVAHQPDCGGDRIGSEKGASRHYNIGCPAVSAEQNPHLQSVNATTTESKTEKIEAPVAPAPSVTPVVSTKEAAKDANATKLYDFPLSENSNVSIVFLTCCLRH